MAAARVSREASGNEPGRRTFVYNAGVFAVAVISEDTLPPIKPTTKSSCSAARSHG